MKKGSLVESHAPSTIGHRNLRLKTTCGCDSISWAVRVKGVNITCFTHWFSVTSKTVRLPEFNDLEFIKMA